MNKDTYQLFGGKMFRQPLLHIQALKSIELKEAFEAVEGNARRHYVLGYVSYQAKDVFLGKTFESETPLLYFEVFDRCYDYQAHPFRQSLCLFPQPQVDYPQYDKAIAAIKDEIACGNTYELNYTYACKLPYKGDVYALFDSLSAQQQTPYQALIQNAYEEVLSFSPELFFSLEGNRIRTKPMKGTIARKTNEREDYRQREILKNDTKNRAENVMIVDLLRNDLSKIAQTGSVKVNKLFEIETYQTLHQMISEVEASLHPDVSLYDIFQAIFPCGSVTGAPKIKTMELIDRIEKQPRDIYCGAIGLLSPEACVFSVPIRILQRKKGEKDFRYQVGGAVVWDSRPEEEWEETRIKSLFLTRNNPEFSLIETIKVEKFSMLFWEAHLQRMKLSAHALGFYFNPELDKLQATQNGIMRIVLAKDGNYTIDYAAFEESTCDKVSLACRGVDSTHPLLYHKTTYRPHYEESMLKIRRGEIYDELYYNEKDELTEGARSNIILKIEGQYVTPKVESGLLNGIYRQKLLEQKFCVEKTLYVSDLYKATHIFCVNAVRGIKKVRLL